MSPRIAAGERLPSCSDASAIGLENDEVGLADYILTLPVNPAFASLNLAQAVAVVAYEWFKLVSGGALPFSTRERPSPPPRSTSRPSSPISSRSWSASSSSGRRRSAQTMLINLRNLFRACS